MKNTKGYKIFEFIMKTISWCVMSILILIGAFLIVYLIINKTYQAQGKTPPLGLYTIISPSMTPDIAVYDVVFVSKKEPEDIKVGDVVSYYSTKTNIFGTTPITHRVVEKFNTNNGVSFRTKGDANPVIDNEIVSGSSVIGTVKFVIPQLGRLQFFLASKGGWFVVILVPALGIIIYDIIKLVKLINVKNKMEDAKNVKESPSKKADKLIEKSFKNQTRDNINNKNTNYKNNNTKN